MKKIRVMLFAFAFSLIFTLAGCGGKGSIVIPSPDADFAPILAKQSEEFVKFVTPNANSDLFMNEYLERHLRYNDNRIGTAALGSGVMFAKEWESKSLMWFDTSYVTVPDDRYAMLKSMLERVNVDRFGYVWQSSGRTYPTTVANSHTYFMQGWPFPSFETQGIIQGTNFNKPTSEGWEVNDGASYTMGSGLMSIAYRGEALEITSPVWAGVPTFYAPFVAVGLTLQDDRHMGSVTDIDDIYLYWKTTEAGGDEWSEDRCVKQSEFATIPEPLRASNQRLVYFPMYAHEKWGAYDNLLDPNEKNAPKVTQMKIVVKAKDDDMEIKANFDFIRMEFDNRVIQDNSLFLTSAVEYYKYTQDKEFLQNNMERFRKAIQFYLTYTDGYSGIIDAGYLIGHDGIPILGHGNSAGYNDILALPAKSFYFNVYYYRALTAIAYLESCAEALDLQAPEAKVTSWDLSEEVTYSEDAESLAEIMAHVRTSIQEYFWDDEKGRFFEGYVPQLALDAMGPGTGYLVDGLTESKIDYGYIAFNLEAIVSGIPTQAQSLRIMDWITGKRAIDSDDSTGSDIYYFECAPRFSTIKNDFMYGGGTWTGGQLKLGEQVQDGGTMMWVTYYDLMARYMVYGIDNYYARMTEIQEWYLKVRAEYEADIASGMVVSPINFYRSYYDYEFALETGIRLQGGGSAGGLGLDFEFLDSSLLYTTFPEALMGLKSDRNGVLSVRAALPGGLEYFKVENMMFGSLKYDCMVGSGFVEISAVRPTEASAAPSNLRIEAGIKNPGYNKFKVMYDKQELAYKAEGDLIIVEVPFQDGIIQIVKN
jgi:predicted small lipoprotein YifL